MDQIFKIFNCCTSESIATNELNFNQIRIEEEEVKSLEFEVQRLMDKNSDLRHNSEYREKIQQDHIRDNCLYEKDYVINTDESREDNSSKTLELLNERLTLIQENNKYLKEKLKTLQVTHKQSENSDISLKLSTSSSKLLKTQKKLSTLLSTLQESHNSLSKSPEISSTRSKLSYYTSENENLLTQLSSLTSNQIKIYSILSKSNHFSNLQKIFPPN
jgi:hypothetical protein